MSDKVVDFKKLLNTIASIKLNDYTEEILYETFSQYEEYILLIRNLDEKDLKQLLETQQYEEMVSTQMFEVRDINLLYENILERNNKKNAIAYLVDCIEKNNKVKNFNIKRVHKILLEGTSIESDENNLFRNNEIFVGYFNNSEKIVQYIPPSKEEIESSVDDILAMLNKPTDSFNDILIKPIICHALMAILQPFTDGNTRISRLIHCINTWQLTNDKYKIDFKMPAIYLSGNYYDYRLQYRDLIKEIATSPTNENWDAWIRFSLFRIQDQLNKTSEYINSSYEINFQKTNH